MYIGKNVKEINGDGKFLGYKYVVDGKLCGHKRCMICGKWFHWQETEKFHCGNSACEYFHQRKLKHQAVKADIMDTELRGFFENPDVVKRLLRKADNIKQIQGIIYESNPDSNTNL